MSDGFLKYREKHLSKVNSIRRAVSQPDIYAVPVLDKAQVLFVPAASMHNEPASCYNCLRYNQVEGTCGIIGERTCVKKFVYGAPDKSIEYWPCCGMHEYGTPNFGPAAYCCTNDPSELGLIWINAPKVGQPLGGANCGGQGGGDDCDYYMTGIDDKREAPTGFCRVLQTEVNNGDVCVAWTDDDRVSWQEAQAILKEQSNESTRSSDSSSGS